MMTIDRVVVSMTPKIEKTTTPKLPRSCSVERLFDDESLVQKYLTLSLKFLAGQINRTIILGRREHLTNIWTLGYGSVH